VPRPLQSRSLLLVALLANLAPSGCAGATTPAGNAAVDAAVTAADASSDADPANDASVPGDSATTDDAAPPADTGANPKDATPDAPSAPDAPAGCGTWAGDTKFTCSADGATRGKCVGTTPSVETCARGCLREPAGDSVCLATTASWSCTGSYGTTRSAAGDYDLTAFGCWKDAAGTVHTDPGDNCIPTCLSKAIAAGVCAPGATGPQCEESVNWYTADGARFGCLQRLKITNPKNGKAVIAVALDYGPGCSVEATVGQYALDASGRVNQYLFGSAQGISDKSLVHVVEVDNSTPLGPVP
jgi:hypothetical protein